MAPRDVIPLDFFVIFIIPFAPVFTLADVVPELAAVRHATREGGDTELYGVRQDLVSRYETTLAICEEVMAWLGVLYWIVSRNGNSWRRLAVGGMGLFYAAMQVVLLLRLGGGQISYYSRGVDGDANKHLFVRPLLFQLVAISFFVVGWHAIMAAFYILELIASFVTSLSAHLPLPSRSPQDTNDPTAATSWSIFEDFTFSPKKARIWMAERSGTEAGMASIWIRYGPVTFGDMLQVFLAFWGVQTLLSVKSKASAERKVEEKKKEEEEYRRQKHVDEVE